MKTHTATQLEALRSVQANSWRPGAVEFDGRTMAALERRGLVRQKTVGHPPWQQLVWVLTDLGRDVLKSHS